VRGGDEPFDHGNIGPADARVAMDRECGVIAAGGDDHLGAILDYAACDFLEARDDLRSQVLRVGEPARGLLAESRRAHRPVADRPILEPVGLETALDEHH